MLVPPTTHVHFDSDSPSFTFLRNTHLALYMNILFALAVVSRGRAHVGAPKPGGPASAGPVGLKSLVGLSWE
jgi:hypothetical protein